MNIDGANKRVEIGSTGTSFFNHQSRRAIERLGARLDGILRTISATRTARRATPAFTRSSRLPPAGSVNSLFDQAVAGEGLEAQLPGVLRDRLAQARRQWLAEKPDVEF